MLRAKGIEDAHKLAVRGVSSGCGESAIVHHFLHLKSDRSPFPNRLHCPCERETVELAMRTRLNLRLGGS